MRSSTLLLLASVLAAHASPLFPRQESSSFDSIYKPAYKAITEFTVEAYNITRCREVADGCGGWIEDTNACSSTGNSGNFSTSFLNAANCLCQNATRKMFDICAPCVGSESATQTSQLYNQLCSVAPADTPATTPIRSTRTQTPRSTSASSGSVAPSGSASAGQGSGAGKLGASLVGGMVGIGLITLFA